jgi:hypothetical protein
VQVILIHAGDCTMFSKSAAAILDFNEWLGDQSCKGVRSSVITVSLSMEPATTGSIFFW